MARVVRILREKRARLEAIEREASRLRAELRAIRAAVGTPGPAAPARTKRAKPSSVPPASPLGLALAVLRAKGRPMGIRRLLQAIRLTSGRKLKRSTLESQLSRYVRKGQLVRRTGPAEFALVTVAPRARPGPSRRRRARKRRSTGGS